MKKCLKLLLMPLVGAASTERSVCVEEARLRAWWHLIVALGTERGKHFHQVKCILVLCEELAGHVLYILSEDTLPVMDVTQILSSFINTIKRVSYRIFGWKWAYLLSCTLFFFLTHITLMHIPI